MTSLLELPTEILVIVLGHVVHAEREPPLEFCEDEQTTRSNIATKQAVHGWFFRERVYCEADPTVYRPNATSLLAVNRKLRHETEALISSRLLVYKLDLAVVQGRSLWPTWTSIPAHRSTVDAVQVKIRVTGPGRPCVRVLAGGCGGPPLWFWWFYTMLEQFFTIGVTPQQAKVDMAITNVTPIEPAPHTNPQYGRVQKMATKILDLDFIDPLVPYEDEEVATNTGSQQDAAGDAESNEEKCVHCGQSCHVGYRGHKHRNWHTNTLYHMLRVMFLNLLNIERARWGDVLHRGIEIVRFRLNGHVENEISLAEYLQDHWPKEHRNFNVTAWVKKTNQIRVAFGLEPSERPRRVNSPE